MNDQPLYDLAPWARLLTGAAFLCAILVAMWWLRHGKANAVRRRRALLLLTIFLTFDLVLVGAFTRLSDSGLGCPDWPGCYGSATPLGAQHPIAQAQAAMSSGPVTHQKAWIEMLHRYLAMALGGLIVLQAGWAWRDRWRRNRLPAVFALPSPWWATAALVWVCVQGAFGALTVTMKLFPAIVSAHLLGAYILLVLLVLQLGCYRRPSGVATALSAGQRLHIGLGLAVVTLQATLGAWVSTNYAVLACSEFPQCQDSWWPLMDFSSGFSFWRPLGMTASGDVLSFQALTAIHMVHRIFAMVVVPVLIMIVWQLRGIRGVRRSQRWLLGLLLLQLLTGLSNVVLDWPLVSAMLHTGGAGALIVTLTWLLISTENQTQLRMHVPISKRGSR
jgi:cytochrome c oxidase assembly protein subunit 15